MTANDRICITGMGVVSPIGIGKEEFLFSLKKGRSGIEEIKEFISANPKMVYTDFMKKTRGKYQITDANFYQKRKEILRKKSGGKPGATRAKKKSSLYGLICDFPVPDKDTNPLDLLAQFLVHLSDSRKSTITMVKVSKPITDEETGKVEWQERIEIRENI